jgi:hypothetical protein
MRNQNRKTFGFWLVGMLLLLLLGGGLTILIRSVRTGPPALSRATKSPIPSETYTLPPTLTATLTFPPTITNTASATPDLSTGNVEGYVSWGGQPFEGVIVRLCTEWSDACKGTVYTAITDNKGRYSFTKLEPGDYQLSTQVPGQRSESRQEKFIFRQGNVPTLVKVPAGETVTLDTLGLCKVDLVIPPPTVRGNYVRFNWPAYPGAETYSVTFAAIRGGNASGKGGQRIYSPWISVTLPAGYYQIGVTAESTTGVCATAFNYFTVP